MDRRKFLGTASAATLGATGLALTSIGCSDPTSPAQLKSHGKDHERGLMWSGPWTPSLLIDWTIMPANVTAQAWTNSTFRNNLLGHPAQTLQAYSTQWPTNIDFEVHADTNSARYLPLPVRKNLTLGWTRQQLLDELIAEMGLNDTTLEFCLPPAVIVEAWLNSTFKVDLLTDANTAIASLGLSVGPYTLVVKENASAVYHLALLKNPLQQEQIGFEELVARLRSNLGENAPNFGTTKCCASGTCDDDD